MQSIAKQASTRRVDEEIARNRMRIRVLDVVPSAAIWVMRASAAVTISHRSHQLEKKVRSSLGNRDEKEREARRMSFSDRRDHLADVQVEEFHQRRGQSVAIAVQQGPRVDWTAL